MDGEGLASSSPRRLPRRQGKAVHHALIVGLLHGLPYRSKGCQLRATFPAPADTLVEAVEAPSIHGPTAALRFGLASSPTYIAYPQVVFLGIPWAWVYRSDLHKQGVSVLSSVGYRLVGAYILPEQYLI